MDALRDDTSRQVREERLSQHWWGEGVAEAPAYSTEALGPA